jgi:hypothetical protein
VIKQSSASTRPGPFRPNLLALVVLAGVALTFTGCSDKATGDNDAGAGGVSAAGGMSTAGGMSAVTGGAPAGGRSAGGSSPGGMSGSSGVSTGGVGSGGMSSGGAGASMGGAGAGGMPVAGAGGSTGGAGAGGMPGGGMGGAALGGAGLGAGSPGGGMSGGGGSAGSGGAEDLDMQPDDFSCIGDWDKVLGFRINNLLGHLDEAIAVAESATGGVYPVGTIIQHLPTEAMVKRRPGFSAATKDWEFFLLQLSPTGETTILERGTTDIQTSMGQTCVSCHTKAAAEFDFICNTWAEQASMDCGFDFTDSFLDMQLAGDTRCD